VLYLASKLLWAVVAPGNLLVLLLALGAAWLVARRGRHGAGIVLASLAGFLAVAILPLGPVLLSPLENRFPVPENLPARIDGIIILGGAIDGALSAARGQTVFTGSASRVTEALLLARQHPEARIVYSSGEAALRPVGAPEAEAGRQFLLRQGIDDSRIIAETRSRNTVENAVFSQALADPQPGQAWVLVTSAFHMPRAVGCFRRIGWDVIPYPVDYMTEPAPGLSLDFDLQRRLVPLTLALKEWIGLVAYRWLDRTSALFPAP
jgi:uncharacterized SAM-binding protein YcdF (DUF218 family)